MKLLEFLQKSLSKLCSYFFDFINLKLNSMRLLGKCFHKKIEYDKKLCLNENSIGLTEGIKIEYK